MDHSLRTASSVSDFNISPDSNSEPVSRVIRKNQNPRLPPALNVENLISKSNASATTSNSAEKTTSNSAEKLNSRSTNATSLCTEDTRVVAYRRHQLSTGMVTPVAWSSNEDRENQTWAAPRSNWPLGKFDGSSEDENRNIHIECSECHRQEEEQRKEIEEIPSFEEEYHRKLQSTTRTGEKYLGRKYVTILSIIVLTIIDYRLQTNIGVNF